MQTISVKKQVGKPFHKMTMYFCIQEGKTRGLYSLQNKKLTIDEGITRVRPKSYYQKKVQKRSMLATSFKVPKRTQRTISKMRG